MTLQPHQQRVVAESCELNDQLKKLAEFMGSEKYGELDPTERDLLLEQSSHMTAYLNVLNLRMERWLPEGATQ